MKRQKAAALVLSAALVGSLLPGARAAAPSQVVTMKINSPYCVVGQGVGYVDEGNAKVAPVAEQVNGGGVTLVPIRRVLEAFGGTAEWVPGTNGVRCSLNGANVELYVGDTTALVNGQSVALDVPAKAMNDRTFVPLRFVSENLGLKVGYEPKNQIVVVADGDLPGDLNTLSQVKTLADKTTPRGEAITHTQKSYATSTGNVTANVLTVDPTDPRVTIQAALPDGKLNNTRPFGTTAANSGAKAVINANFFEAYEAVKDPIGHLMANGQFLYGHSGLSSLGITATGEMRWGRPAIFYRVKTVDSGAYQEWAAFEVNTLKQFENQSVLYTPARGASFPVTYAGVALTVRNGVTTEYRNVAVGENVPIPADGFVLYSDPAVAGTPWYHAPEMGRTVAVEPYLFTEDAEGFTLDGVQTMVSGAPRLVKDGAIDNSQDPGFSEARFTTAVTPRTAIGTTKDNKLLLVQVPAATIGQMKELMLQLGCVDAVNLDGGGSCAMYYNGQTLASPSREPTATLQIFVQ